MISAAASFSEPVGQSWVQFADLALAFVLSSLIGLERELRQKSAGLRTHTLVGVASALIMLVSKFGFTDVLSAHVLLDPSRVAAQIVSGIGFIGGGLIFVRRDAVRGLTTAAIVWLTAAVGMAAGAGLPILAVLVTVAHFLVVFVYTPLAARLPRSKYAPSQLVMQYRDGRGVLRWALGTCTNRGFIVSQLSTDSGLDAQAVATNNEPGTNADHDGHQGSDNAASPVMSSRGQQVVSVSLQIQGRGSVTELAAVLSEINGVLAVRAGDANTSSE